MNQAQDEAVVRLQHLATRLLRLARSPHGAHGLTSAQYSAMAVLHDRPGLSLVDLARFERVAHPTMSRLVKGMEKSGLIARVSSPDDGRSNLIHLTPKGRDLYLQAAARRAALIKDILSQLSPSTVSEITTAIERIAAQEESAGSR